ncbi:uncharacterized protein ACNLHF_017683 [Anomaloglossus baeobatrachus]
MWVHLLLKERHQKGHFNNLYCDLRKYCETCIAFCRLPINGFDDLLSLVRSEITHADTFMRQAISAEERLLVTLRYLATGESFASLHLQFRLGKTTISEIVKETFGAIWKILTPIVMPIPNMESWMNVAKNFDTVANFPNCLGAIDGKHIRIPQPPKSGSTFFNYKTIFLNSLNGCS